MPITNEQVKARAFLRSMYDDGYFPNHLVDKGKQILLRLCERIENEKPADEAALYVLTHAATDEFNACPPVEVSVEIQACTPIIPSADLEKSLRFWVDGLGLAMDRAMRQDGRLVGCMVHNQSVSFWLNKRDGSATRPENYEGIRLYWAPGDLTRLRDRLSGLGFAVSEINHRDYGQAEFFVTDDDGYAHCFGVATKQGG